MAGQSSQPALADLPRVSKPGIALPVSVAKGGTGATTASAARTNLSVQALDADTAKLDVVQDWTAGQSGQVTALSDGANIALNLALTNNFSVTLGGNRALDNPSGEIAGQSGVITVTQDGGAPRTLSFGNQYFFAGGSAPTLSTGNGETDALYYYVEAANIIHISSALDIS